MAENARITWDEAENRNYEYGVSQGVLYPMGSDGSYENGEPWNGLTNITDKPEGAEINEMYADGIYYAGITGAEKYGATIEAFTYPDSFAACDGTAQPIPVMITKGMKLGSSIVMLLTMAGTIILFIEAFKYIEGVNMDLRKRPVHLSADG